MEATDDDDDEDEKYDREEDDDDKDDDDLFNCSVMLVEFDNKDNAIGAGTSVGEGRGRQQV